jgi:hypothetical protein
MLTLSGRFLPEFCISRVSSVENLQNNFFLLFFLNLLYQEITLKLRESILELPVIFLNYSSPFVVQSRKRQSKDFFDYLGHTFFIEGFPEIGKMTEFLIIWESLYQFILICCGMWDDCHICLARNCSLKLSCAVTN